MPIIKIGKAITMVNWFFDIDNKSALNIAINTFKKPAINNGQKIALSLSANLLLLLYKRMESKIEPKNKRAGVIISKNIVFPPIKCCLVKEQFVDLGGIEPPLPQCECGVMPLDHRPKAMFYSPIP